MRSIGVKCFHHVSSIATAGMFEGAFRDDMFEEAENLVLKGSGIACPKLDDYANRIWDYWERNLDPALFIDHTPRGQVEGKVVLVTDGSSGIGLTTAHKLAEAGAITIICGRDENKLAEAKKAINDRGVDVITYRYTNQCTAFLRTCRFESGLGCKDPLCCIGIR